MNPTYHQLLFGVAYYDEYMPCQRLSQDMELLCQAGFNLIRIAESTWSTWEPEDGRFDFTHLHRVLQAAQENGLSVIVGTPTYAIPPWLAAKYPDILSDTHSGPCRYGARQNFDLTHPGYRFHAERMIRRLMEQVQPYSCVIGFQLDNETKPYDTCSPRAQALFKAWLQEQFPTTDELNQAFGFAYWSNSISSWDDLPDVRGTINASFGAAYQAFQRQLVTEFLSWQRGIVDEYRRPEQFVTHNFDYSWRNYSFGIQPEVDQFQAAEAVTIAGCDIYHPSGEELTGAEISFGGAVARGLKGGNYLVLETEAQGNLGWLPYPGQLRLQAYSHLACGADGIEYWHWHSIHNAVESYWKGVLSHDFSAGAIYREAALIGEELRSLSPHLLHLKKANRIAVMVSNRSLTGMQWFPTCGIGETPAHDYNDYLRWLCDSLYRLNAEYDIIPDTVRDFSGYDLLILPCLYAAPDDLPEAISSYVKKGGHLIATFKTCFANEDLKIRHQAQPYGLTDCLGLRYDRFTRPREVYLRFQGFPAPDSSADAAGFPDADGSPAPDVSPDADNFPDADGSLASGVLPDIPRNPSLEDRVSVSDWMELLEPMTAKALYTYDHPAWGGIPAVTWNSYGKGQSVYLGCCFDPAALDFLLRGLLTRFGIPLPGPVFPVIVKSGINGQGRTLRYFLNYSWEKQTVSVSHGAGHSLPDHRLVAADAPVTVEPWNVVILEEQPLQPI